MKMPTVGSILFSFFEDYLKNQKGLSMASVKSYRDGLCLFLRFAAQDTKHRITQLALTDLTAEQVSRFLNYLEAERNNHIRTRNQRLSVLHVFFDYVGCQVPEMLIEAERIAAIPMKRVSPAETFFLEREELDTLFANLPTTSRFALRDRTLLLFLYNTGGRAQEVADLRTNHLELTAQPRVHLHGKGDKWRSCPLWKTTAVLLEQLISQPTAAKEPDRPVFTSLHGQPLTRHGIYKIIRRHTDPLVKVGANCKTHKISPHVIRHTTAAHLLEAGVELNVIRSWLGHVSVETTNRYAEINMRMKEAALARCEPPGSVSTAFPKKGVWRDEPALLKWLQSL